MTKNFWRLTETLKIKDLTIHVRILIFTDSQACSDSPLWDTSYPVLQLHISIMRLKICQNKNFPKHWVLLTLKSSACCLFPSLLSVSIIIFLKIRKSHFYHWRARLLRSQDSLGLILEYESWTFPNKCWHSSDDQASLLRLPELSTLIITMFKVSKAVAD